MPIHLEKITLDPDVLYQTTTIGGGMGGLTGGLDSNGDIEVFMWVDSDSNPPGTVGIYVVVDEDDFPDISAPHGPSGGGFIPVVVKLGDGSYRFIFTADFIPDEPE